MTIRLVCAEDNYLVREGTRLLLATQPDIELLDSVSTMPDLLDAVARLEPDVVLTDIRMPPSQTDEGIRAAEHLAVTHPEVGIVVLSQYVEPSYALRLFQDGSRGRAYLLKERLGDVVELRKAIEAVHAGGTMLDPVVVDALVAARQRKRESLLSRLTPREHEVLAHIAKGSANVTIAEALALTERAVAKHINALFAKLELSPDDVEVHRRVRAVLLYLAETRS
ncbi:response regulator transcription factor [Nocardioides limicola]|uniref:response regulator transcription factor n=1 Tax=Nocardioides limicola TaxID=2803368 RepID=UPI001EF12AF2|nr:response regulator transcription factor [Nocardioides sp. DJM-14]